MKAIKSDPSKTVLTITLGFLIIYLVSDNKWFLGIALVIGLLGLMSSYLAKKIEFLWMKLAWLLSLIVPNILLSIVFYLFLVPIAFLSRIFGKKDPMHLKNNSDSVFKTVDKEFKPSSFDNPW